MRYGTGNHAGELRTGCKATACGVAALAGVSRPPSDDASANSEQPAVFIAKWNTQAFGFPYGVILATLTAGHRTSGLSWSDTAASAA